MVKAVLPVTPALVAEIVHDHDLDGDGFRCWLWLCTHLTDGNAGTFSLDEITKGLGLRRQSRALTVLNDLIQAGYVIVEERQWKLHRLVGVVLRLAAKPSSATPQDRAVALWPTRG